MTTIPTIKESETKVFLVDIVSKDTDKTLLKDRMDEIENLVTTYGGMVILKTYQKRDNPDLTMYIGKGKLEEIMTEMEACGANLLIIGNILKPRQIYALGEKFRPLGIQVRDRMDLILKIFDKHAESTEAKMQVDLAAITHMGPRIFGMGIELGRQGGSGSGAMRGLGETNTEIMKRHLKEKKLKIIRNLEEYERMRMLHRQSRIKKGLPVVGIVGYTNAGKSSLLNALTKKGVLAENKLFATLGTNVGKVFLMNDDDSGRGKEILFSDTIGFIRDLPPQLIQAFKSTLEDSIESDVLFHVVDASDPYIEERIRIVNEILDNIGAKQPRILVFNKLDLCDQAVLASLKYRYANQDCLRISVLKDEGLEELKERVKKFFAKK